MPAKKKVTPAFRFPKTFTAKVTEFIFDTAVRRRTTEHFWLLGDCPLSVAVRRALKVTRTDVSTSRVDCTVVAPTGKWRSRRYTHDGVTVVKAFDEKLALTLPQTVTFTLEKVQE